MQKLIYILLSIVLLISCKESSSIRVQNMLPKAVIRNIEWGGVPISSQIMPGESSTKITIMEDEPYYDIHLPESNPLKFYINLNGDKIYVETKASYMLGKDEEIILVIEDTTKIFNPLVGSE